jgi:glyoxylase-like metal-dependent hydrolase (beta-lactamase superfamily II)
MRGRRQLRRRRAALGYERLRQVTEQASVVLADNPDQMTLDGTNTWLLRADPSSRQTIVVDPGPADDRHLDAVLDAAGEVSLILLTHGHSDHSDGAERMHERTGADVLALDPKHRYGAQGLAEGTVLRSAGLQLEVWQTPGHSSDSLCLVLPVQGLEDTARAGEVDLSAQPVAVLTGDTILGRGTTVVAHPDGVLADYLQSLRRLTALDGVALLPGHGRELADAGAIARAYLAHREQRLQQVRGVLQAIGPDVTARQIVEIVYADVEEKLWPAAELSVQAQLLYLQRG